MAVAGGLLPNGLQQVGLAQTDTGIQEEGVVSLTRSVGHRLGGAERHPVGVADDETIEGMFDVEAEAGIGGQPGWRPAGVGAGAASEESAA